MWPLTKKLSKDILSNTKSIKVHGFKFRIRKINPLIDFEGDDIPELFTIYQKPKVLPTNINLEFKIKQFQKDMRTTIKAGLVEPNLEDNPDKITMDDLFRDPDLAYALYSEIVAHSLKRFSGMKGLFFYLKTKLSLFIHYRQNMESLRQILSFKPENFQ
jgi:hypothetical protein